jgi:predicted dehydrogenase
MLTIAQIGCGYWGPNLLRNLAVLPNARVGLVVEAAAERREYVTKNFPGVPVAVEVGRAVDDPAIEAVVIATPARTHFDLARRALRAGKHIFVEKPLAMSVREVDALAAIAREKNRVVMAGHTFLYNSAVRHLRSLVESGELGQLHYAYSQRLNLGIVRSDINVMWNLAPHDVAILCHLFGGPPQQVEARGTAFIQPGIEDVVFMDLVWPGGVRGHVHVSWLDPNKVRGLTLVGSRKMAVYDDMAKEKIMLYDKGADLVPEDRQGMPFDRPPQNRIVHRVGEMTRPALEYPEPLQVELQHFADCIRSGAEPLTGITHARQVVGVLETAQHFMERQRAGTLAASGLPA